MTTKCKPIPSRCGRDPSELGTHTKKHNLSSHRPRSLRVAAGPAPPSSPASPARVPPRLLGAQPESFTSTGTLRAPTAGAELRRRRFADNVRTGVGAEGRLRFLRVAGWGRGDRRPSHSAAASAESGDGAPDPGCSPVTSSSALKWLPVACSPQPGRGGGARAGVGLRGRALTGCREGAPPRPACALASRRAGGGRGRALPRGGVSFPGGSGREGPCQLASLSGWR